MKIIVASFGFKFGTPKDADILIDARSLRNPFNRSNLRHKSGLDDEVWKFVTKTTAFSMWKSKAVAQANAVVQAGLASGARQVAIGVGCVGGRHRSVVGCMEIARAIWWTHGKTGKHQILTAHRDITKGEPVGKIMTARELVDEFKQPAKQFNTKY